MADSGGSSNRPLNMKAIIYRWHRRFGVLTFLFVAVWAFSGVLHPIMVWTSPKSAVFAPPPESATALDHVKTDLADTLARNGIKSFTSARLMSWGERAYYEVSPSNQGEPLLFDAETGELKAGGIRDYAIDLAQHYSGDRESPVNSVERIDHFGKEFVAFNQLLPVYRVNFARPDGLRVYVDPESGMLGDVIDNWKGGLEWSFQTLHLLDWLTPLHSGLGTVAAALFASLSFFSAITGLVFALRSSSGKRAAGTRFWHRRFGLAVGVFLCLAAFSGAVQAGFKFRSTPSHEVIYRPEIATSELAQLRMPKLEKGDRFNVVSLNGNPLYQVATSASGSDVSVKYTGPNGQELPPETEKAYAVSLASHFTGVDASKIQEARQIFHFDSEYGFFRRRLPVWRIAFVGPTSTRCYVDTLTSRLVLQQDDWDTAHNLIFAFLHKYNWIDAALGNGTAVRAFRDIFSALVTTGIGLVAISGMLLLRRTHGGKTEGSK